MKLIGSVGRGGVNYKTDVKLVQILLNQYKIPGVITPLKVDGLVGEKTYTRIEMFQRKILHWHQPDGLVEPNGRTFYQLTHRPGTKSAASYTVSNKGLELLKSIEELALHPYDDQTGKDIHHWVPGATIGYGHLIAKLEWDKYKNGITAAQAIALFKKDLSPFVNKVRLSITAKITQNEFDALVILTFNIGAAAFGRSSVMKLVNNPVARTSYPSLEKAWMAWTRSQGRINRGLVARRKAEWNIYANNIYKRW